MQKEKSEKEKEEEERREEEKKHVEQLRKRVSEGELEATLELASRLHYGEGVSQNVEESLSLYHKAAEKGSNRAKHQLGVIYSMRMNYELAMKV